MGDALKAQGKLQLALKAYQAEAVAAKSAIKIDANDKYAPRDLVQAGSNIGAVAYDFILAREFAKALDAADIANSFAPGEVWIHARRAHALMFLGRTAEARNIYIIFRGQKSNGDKSWEADVLSDFADLRKHRLSHPLMDEIKKLFRAPK